MRILIVKLSAIGDVLHTLPALNALRAHYPSAHITWLVEEAASDLVVGHPALDRVLISKRKRWMRGLLSGEAVSHGRAAAAFLKALRDTRYDTILDFHGLLKSSLLVFLSCGKRKIGFGKGMEHMEKSHFFLNKRIPAVSMEHHALRRQLMLLEALGIHCKKIVYDVPIGIAARKEASKLLSSQGIHPGISYAAVNPGAKWKSKLWRAGKFAEVADHIASRYVIRVVFTGSTGDAETIEAIRGRMKEPSINIAGKTTLKELGAIYENAKIVLSTDTGPMHLAAAVGTPVVALFGPTAPWRTGPFGKKHNVIRAGTECSPCFKRDCPLDGHGKYTPEACMELISVQKVIEAVEKLMNKR